MADPVDLEPWLARLRHDLVKRLVWPARDRRDLGGPPVAGELTPRITDDEGQPTTTTARWAALADEAPPGLDLTLFAEALRRATAAAEAGELAGVLALEAAFDQLAARARKAVPGVARVKTPTTQTASARTLKSKS